MTKHGIGIACALVFWMFCSSAAPADALQTDGGRVIKLTLIPDYQNNTILFNGTIDANAPLDDSVLDGLPLKAEHQWKDDTGTTLNITGKMLDGKIAFDSETKTYHLLLGRFHLKPQDKLTFFFTFVNLDYNQIDPLPDPDNRLQIFRRYTHAFSYQANAETREIPLIDIPFTPVGEKIDLIFTPLMGETLIGKPDGLRLAGRVTFNSFTDYEEFSRHCQNTSNRLKYGDYRTSHLLSSLDFPHYSGFALLNPVFQFKPDNVALKSELITCEFEQEKNGIAASFSGRVYQLTDSENSIPSTLQETDFVDGNYFYKPSLPFKGVQGYEIRLGGIILAPGDTLAITVPHTQIQADALTPPPSSLIYAGSDQQTHLMYQGPMTFDLSIPYVPQSQLFLSQFPAIVRPSLSLIEDKFGALFFNNKPRASSRLTWMILLAGIILLLASTIFERWNKPFAFLGWTLSGAALFYGLRGSFGLIVLVLILHFFQSLRSGMKNASPLVIEWIKILIVIILIGVAIYFDTTGTQLFRDLSTSDLSPLTPVILTLTIGTTFILLFGWRGLAWPISADDLPVMAFLLLILCIYDAHDKSLLALTMLGLGGLYIANVLSFRKKSEGSNFDAQLSDDLKSRLRFILGNRVIPLSIGVLILFAVGNDLASPYANEMHIALPSAAASLLIPILIFASVFITFSSIALLFILIYPFIPFKAGYIKAIAFALFLFIVFLFGIGTDDRLIATLPTVLVGRVIYYFSVPLLIGIYFDVHEFMQKENQNRSAEGKEGEAINFQTASGMYFKRLQGIMGVATGVLSLVAPSIYAFISSQPVIVTYFNLLEKLVLLPI